MKIEMNTIYHLPTQAHEDDFLKQAEKQGFEWATGRKATSESYWNNGEYCIRTKDKYLAGHDSKSPYERTFPNLPIIEWKIGFTKADMQEGQAFKTRCGSVLSWEGRMPEYYKDDLTDFDSDTAMDIIEVYPLNLTPIWKRPDPKYRVKTELTKEQAEKLGMELCEEVTE